MKDPRCGTYAGVLAHRKRKEPACEDCVVARRRYSKKRRVARASLGLPEYDKTRARARERALRVLGRNHPEELERLIQEEM